MKYKIKISYEGSVVSTSIPYQSLKNVVDRVSILKQNLRTTDNGKDTALKIEILSYSEPSPIIKVMSEEEVNSLIKL